MTLREGTTVELRSGDYTLRLEAGGLEVLAGERVLYVNDRPLRVTVKTVAAISEYSGAPYDDVSLSEGAITASGTITVRSGSAFAVTDVWRVAGDGFSVHRDVEVLAAGGEYLSGRPDSPKSFYEAKYRDPRGIVFDLTHTGWAGSAKDVIPKP